MVKRIQNALPMAAWLVFGLLISTQAPAASGPYVGQTAPEFELENLHGEPTRLAQLRKQGHVLVVFWSTQCHICHAMLPDFKRVHEQYQDKGLTVAAVNVGMEDMNAVQAYALKYDVNYLVLNDDDKKMDLVEDYQLRGTPTIELIAPDGEVLYRAHRLPELEKYLPDDRAASQASRTAGAS